jgi:uncharacterized surface protein with fasciclin (FAS1) repeats
VTLVERTRRVVRFTPLGDRIADKARRVLREAEELGDLARAAGRPLSGEMRMSVIPTIAPFMLPRVLPRLRRDYPDLKLFLREEPSGPACEGLHNGRTDCVLLALPYACGEVAAAPLFDDRLFVAAPEGEPPAAATIAVNVARAPNLTTFVSTMRAAGLDRTLAGAGPYTLFAPTNAAFGRLAPGTVDALLKPENKASLARLLDYLVVAGRVTTADLRDRIQAGGGSATLATIKGDPLTVTLTGAVLTLTDVHGNKSYIEAGDVPQANGLIQVVNGVLIPDLG